MFGIVSLTRPIRLSIAFIAFATVVVGGNHTLSPAFAQDGSQPYMVYVDHEGVTARCGPGGEYYRTDPLRHGQALEVYVETEDGWLGIRPPDGSFCWLPADVIKLSPSQDFGIVTEDNSLAWIGTHLGKANKYLWQVQLAKGEEVAILGRAQREGPDGPKLWFRIVPPPGEFRWVHKDQVVENPEMLLRERPQSSLEVAIGQPTLAPEPAPSDAKSYGDEETDRHSEEYGDDYIADTPKVASVLPGTRRESIRGEKSDGLIPLPTPIHDQGEMNRMVGSGLKSNSMGNNLSREETSADNELQVARAYEAPLVSITSLPAIRSIGQTAAIRSQPSADESVDSFDRRNTGRVTPTQSSRDSDRLAVEQSQVVIHSQVMPVSNVVRTSSNYAGMLPPNSQNVDALQVELSRLMSRSASAIEVEPVLIATAMHSRTSSSEDERQRAAMLTQRAQQYQQIARRRDASSASGQPVTTGVISSDSPLGYPAPVQSLGVPSPPVSASSGSEQISGYLVQVFSSRPDSPPFALTDKQGRTVFYVSPAPGVNLRRYLNQFINVTGQAGYATGLDTPHVIATSALRSLEE